VTNARPVVNARKSQGLWCRSSTRLQRRYLEPPSRPYRCLLHYLRRLMLRSSPPSTSSPVCLTARPCADARRRSPRSSRNGGRAAAEVPRLRHRLRSGGRFHVLPLIYLCFCRSRTPTHRLPYEREPRERRWPARMRTSPRRRVAGKFEENPSRWRVAHAIGAQSSGPDFPAENFSEQFPAELPMSGPSKGGD
jgi:hypothetical protein